MGLWTYVLITTSKKIVLDPLQSHIFTCDNQIIRPAIELFLLVVIKTFVHRTIFLLVVIKTYVHRPILEPPFYLWQS
jgi:hypothetical protein